MEKDPYRYFRVEARELVESLSAGVLEIEAGAGPETVTRLMRHAHTLKGAARVVRQVGIAEDAHAVEEHLGPWRAGGVVPPDRIEALLALVDRIALAVAAVDARPETSPGDAASAAEEPFESVRIDIAAVDGVLDGISEAAARFTALRRDVAELDQARRLAAALREHLAARHATAPGARTLALVTELGERVEQLHRRLGSGVEHAERELVGVRDRANGLRLVEASVLFPALTRTARDAAHTLGRRVVLDARGADVRIDAHVLAALRHALMHLVRNAVAHGIESEPERVRQGKPAEGRIEIAVERRGSRVAFRCRDDGAGVSAGAVRDVALRRGLLAPEAASAFTLADAVRLLLHGGISTSASVNEVAGRGVGLDVVRETAARLKGDMTVESEAGRGTVVELCVPVTLSSVETLEVEAGDLRALLPLDSVVSAAAIDERDVARSPAGASILHAGEALPFAPLATLLGRPSGPARPRGRRTLVILRSPAGRAAVEVERLVGTTRVVVRPLPPLAPVGPVVAGAALDAEGTPRPLLDADALVRAVRHCRGAETEAAGARVLPVLVIDDSLTTRMLEQSILESAGYEVDLAASAEAGLAKARERRYGLFIVDVEMPGMDGFGFVAATRSDAELREIPAILVTSRSSPEDRRRGREVGARAYIVKSEFDQEQLLATIRGLVG